MCVFRDAGRLQDEWFTDPDRVRERVGLLEQPPADEREPEPDNAECAICFERFPLADMLCARCRHRYCKDCWAGYVNVAIDGGPACLDLRCPDPKCIAVVPTAVVTEVASVPAREKYTRFAVRSFVEDNKQLAWCPAPGEVE
jgi:ariadne-1